MAAMTIEIAEVRGHRFVFEYKVGRLGLAVVAEAVEGLKDKLPDGISVDDVNQKIIIDLMRIKKDGTIIERIYLKCAFVTENGLVVDFHFS